MFAKAMDFETCMERIKYMDEASPKTEPAMSVYVQCRRYRVLCFFIL